jgi:predicted GIY-YIG superfamily endonuclease
LAHEVNNLKHDLQLNGFPPKLINTVINNTGGNNRLRNEVKPIGSVVIPYVKGISDKFKRIGNRYIRTIFKTKHTLRNTFMRTKPMSDPQRTAQCIYNILCEYGRSYVGETGRPLSVRIWEHKFNLKNGLLDKSKLAQHAFEEGHHISWKEAKILQIEVNSRQRKYKESAHMACMENPISQHSLEFSPSGSLWSKRRSIPYTEGATSSPSLLI